MQETKSNAKFPRFGWLGLLIIVVAEILLILDVKFVKNFFTPIVWTGYILFIDALLEKIGGNSYLLHRRQSFLIMLPVSLACWLIFEGYNLHLRNWVYLNLPENMALRMLGYVWSFITIFPGVLLTSEVIDELKIFAKVKTRRFVISNTTRYVWMFIGMLFLIVPLVLPARFAAYLFGLVWMGFIFVIDPLNLFLGQHSLFGDLRTGQLSKLLSLFLSGAICGLLWEFWNYWATTKWIYILPFLQHPKIFEMPAAGFLGFLPFAVECYVLWILIRLGIQRATGLKLARTS
ncbi:MAG: hypothetical protein ONB16_01370 [candidate division KSB1 bacterium]|nr:hypothetical protein [candidate division KSB1 bacterium]MDZ7318100.1 hypothetical protein [candidate division KSB1 bacterium]MDZ7342243.1 hypothetical protein [candidate division KSB1 bacterium]